MHVVGLRPVDDKWRAMKAAWDACELIGAPIPTKVYEFFDGVYPKSETVIEVELDKSVYAKYNDDGQSGFDVDLRRLPDDVTMVRFFCAY